MSKITKQQGSASKKRGKRSLTGDDLKALIDDWEANHPNVQLDDKQKQFMLRVHLHMQKEMPGWTL